MKHSFKKVFLLILDGFGLAPASKDNPVTVAGMPFLNSLIAKHPAFSIAASGLVVGLPWGKSGNSEVGHSAIGTGRVIVQDWARINTDIKSGVFYKNKAFLEAVEHCKKNNSVLHLIGCASQGGIHAHEDHLIALLDFATREKVASVRVHMITDGEDSGPVESLATLVRLQPHLEKANAKIATIMGRTYAMDRVLNWKITQKAFDAMVKGVGEPIEDPAVYLKASHAKKIFDDLIVPGVVAGNTIQPKDAIIFFNYRNDRMKQLLQVFKDYFTVSMTRYSLTIPVSAVAYEPPDIHHTLGKEISRRGLKQFRIAEQEKAAHINNFFNGGRIDPYEGTEQVIVESRQLKGDAYLEHPEMSANNIVKELLARAEKDFIFYLANFANADMMGHTGNKKATVAGLQVIDESIKKIATEVLKNPDHALVITCDHGNCEEVIDPATGEPDTQHSPNNVFALFAGDALQSTNPDATLDSLIHQQTAGSLIDVAPSILHLLSLEKPAEMTGSPLI